MIIAALQKVSLIDFPGKVSAVVFTRGCNARCGYCHNPQLVLPERFEEPIPETEVLQFLSSRRGKLDGVVITGGEPTMHEGLPDFLTLVKSLGFSVKLDTNGTNPGMLRRLIDSGLVDYFAVDIKGSKAQYSGITRVYAATGLIEESVKQIQQSGIPSVFRTTLVKQIHTPESIAEAEDDFGVTLYLQRFLFHDTLVGNGFTSAHEFTDDEVLKFGRNFSC